MEGVVLRIGFAVRVAAIPQLHLHKQHVEYQDTLAVLSMKEVSVFSSFVQNLPDKSQVDVVPQAIHASKMDAALYQE